VRRLADDIGIKKVYVVGNKIADGQDETLVRENLEGLPLLGFLSLNDRIIEADKRGVSPYDLSEKVREEVAAVLDSLEDLTG